MKSILYFGFITSININISKSKGNDLQGINLTSNTKKNNTQLKYRKCGKIKIKQSAALLKRICVHTQQTLKVISIHPLLADTMTRRKSKAQLAG